MNIGGTRRSAPSAPPIPVPPPPPSAYGIDLQGPAAPAASAPPAPPAAAPAYQPPVNDYAAYAPAPGFGGPPSQYGAPPAQFGGPQTPFGAPPAQYGVPAMGWAPAPAPKSKTRRLALTVAAAVGVLAVIGVGLAVFDQATAHHVTALPATLSDLTLDQDPQVQAAMEQAKAQASSDHDMRSVKNWQMGLYQGNGRKFVAEIGDVPGAMTHQRDQFMQSFAGAASSGQGVTMAPVDAGPKGGSVQCGVSPSGMAICVWVDKGTLGAVFGVGATQQDAQDYLNTLRDATEH